MLAVLTGTALGAAAMPAGAFSITSHGVTFSVTGDLNVNYTYTACDTHPEGTVAGSLLCINPGGAFGKSNSSSSINSGNLPTGIVFAVDTTQGGVDFGAKVGYYPGLVNNDFVAGNGPNLGTLGGNTALSATNLDIRQAYATVGTPQFGTLEVGRDYSMVGLDAIVNDITLIADGVASIRTSNAPANTTLGTIGFGHLYPSPQAQITYASPKLFGGLVAAVGIFQPTDASSVAGVEGASGVTYSATSAGTPKRLPGFQGKLRYDYSIGGFSGFVSTAALYQQQELTGGALDNSTPDSAVGDVAAKVSYGPVSLFGHYYVGRGIGIYSYFIDGFSPTGHARESHGGYIQATYTWDKTTFGANYGVSALDMTEGDTDPNLLKRNSKFTFGVYHKLFPNVTLTAEFTHAFSKNNADQLISTENFNVGTFITF